MRGPGTLPVPVIRTDPMSPAPGDSLAPPPGPPSDMRRRVARLLLLRTLVVSVVLGLSMWLIAAGAQPARAAVWIQSAIIAATYGSSIVFGVLLRQRRVELRRVASAMHVADVAITSALVCVTGGAQSPYTFLYALGVVSAGALSYRRGAVAVTSASIAAMIVVALIVWLRGFDLPISSQLRPWEQSTADFGRTLGIQLAALIGVGALAFIFGDQLQKGAEMVATTRKAAADLFTLHQDIVRSLASGLITIAADGTVTTANQAAADILRRRAGELNHQSIDAVMPGLSGLLAESANGELRRADLELGATTVGVTVSPLRDVKDQVIGRVVNFQDLTELRRLESHARRSERLATVGQLAAGIAHEIRNPLAAISGSIELLRQGPVVSEDDRVLMTIVHREIQRLNELIGDLLDYANPRPTQAVDLDLGVVVREIATVSRGDQAFAAIELVAEAERPLPIHGDPAKLRQVLWNLLRNAADAAAAGGRHVAIEARRDRDTGDVLVVVTDDGCGIPPAQLGRIFDPFFTTKQKGTGLGLATCHAIVAEAGGRIDVSSEVDVGTQFVIRLPASSGGIG